MGLPSGLLLLADSRLPSGGHGHSGGVEALVDRGLLRTEDDLATFLAGRLVAGAAAPPGRRPRRARWPGERLGCSNVTLLHSGCSNVTFLR